MSTESQTKKSTIRVGNTVIRHACKNVKIQRPDGSTTRVGNTVILHAWTCIDLERTANR